MIHSVEAIAYIRNEYKDKFGIPRQSGLVNRTISEIIFYEKYRDNNALRGLEQYSHIWLLWIFTEAECEKEWNPTVRPPRLGGNKRVGVFSTRSPFHPNRIGLSCVKIQSIDKTNDLGTIIKVTGADLLDGTPIIDIKPYLAFTDSHPDAICGFADDVINNNVNVSFSDYLSGINDDLADTVCEILSQNPKPSYQNDYDRIYSMRYSDYDIKFMYNKTGITVTDIIKLNGSEK